MALIRAHDLRKTYIQGTQQVSALQHVSLSVESGEFVAIMGASGSGKSTLMNILGCLDTPTSGQYFLNNKAVHTLSGDALARVRNQDIGFVFQQFHLLARTSAIENVALPLLYASVPHHERMERAKAALEKVGLLNRMHHTPVELSGGQQQRVAIARALVNQASLILADEPTGALDSHTAHDILTLLRELNESGITILMVTHDSQVASWAKRVIRVQDGQIVDDVYHPSTLLKEAV